MHFHSRFPSRYRGYLVPWQTSLLDLIQCWVICKKYWREKICVVHISICFGWKANSRPAICQVCKSSHNWWIAVVGLGAVILSKIREAVCKQYLIWCFSYTNLCYPIDTPLVQYQMSDISLATRSPFMMKTVLGIWFPSNALPIQGTIW